MSTSPTRAQPDRRAVPPGAEARPSRPAPVLTDDNEGFWLAAKEHRLVVQQCSTCQRFRHPPRPLCPHCGSLEWRWTESSGRGVVYSFAFLHHPQHPAFSYPVLAVLVDLDEGVRLVSNLVGTEHGDVRIGMQVEVDFEETADDFSVPVFRPRSVAR